MMLLRVSVTSSLRFPAAAAHLSNQHKFNCICLIAARVVGGRRNDSTWTTVSLIHPRSASTFSEIPQTQPRWTTTTTSTRLSRPDPSPGAKSKLQGRWGRTKLLSLPNPSYGTNIRRHYPRFQSSSAAMSDEAFTSTNDGIEHGELMAPFYDPIKDFGELKMPSSLSPSAALEFKKCPQSYLFQYLYKLRQPTTPALAKGSMCHEALEKVFDLDPPDRTLENLQNLLRVSWKQHRLTDNYRSLFEKNQPDDTTTATTTTSTMDRDIEAEREWGKSALKLLENYYHAEDPKTVLRPNPLRREIWLHSHLALDPTLGVTGPAGSTEPTSPSETFYVRGIVDRLDMVKVISEDEFHPDKGQTTDGRKKQVALKIVDYKTGKAPDLKYSRPVNDRIVEEAFYQLKVYALLLREKSLSHGNKGVINSRGDASGLASLAPERDTDDDFLTIMGDGGAVTTALTSVGSTSSPPNVMELRYLQLLYLTSAQGPAKILEYDLGETQDQRDVVLQEVHEDLANVWTSIKNLVQHQDPKAFVGCDRSFCYCHKCRPRFVPGSVWEPPPK